MTSIADSSVSIQASSESVPSTPCWLGEVVLLVEYLCKQGVLAAINERVRFARRRFGHYEVIDLSSGPDRATRSAANAPSKPSMNN